MAKVAKREWVNPKGEKMVAYLARYKDGEGKRRFKQFEKKKDAEAFLLTAQVEVRRGVHTADSQSITVAEAGTLWIDGVKAEGREGTTVRNYEGWKKNHIDPLLGTEKLSRLTAPVVEQFRKDLLAGGRSKAMTGKVLGGLRMMLTASVRSGLVAHNVAKEVKPVKRTKREKKKVRIPTREELKALVDTAREHYPDLVAFILLAIVTGLRVSELRGLRWEDVDLKAGKVSVEQRADEKNVLGPCKSEAAYRTLSIAPAVVVELKAWRLRCPKGELGLVFPNTEGGVWQYQNLLRRRFQPLQEKAKIAKPYGFHALRHAAASAWISRRVDLKRLTTWLGHESVEMTLDTYGHLMVDEEADEAVAAATVAGLV